MLLPICDRRRARSWSGRACRRTLGAYVDATTLEGAKQTIAHGPVASQDAIKKLGTNGGGFFNANCRASVREPDRADRTSCRCCSIFAIGAALTNTFGRMVGDQRQGWAIFAVMGVLFLAGVAVAYWAEGQRQPGTLAVTDSARCSPAATWKARRSASASPTPRCSPSSPPAASCGAVNAMHDSFTPLGGMIPLVNIQLGEIIVGGVGAGLYGMLLFVILAVFVAGLMVGRTPEYLGKKIEAKEVKMAMLAILILPLIDPRLHRGRRGASAGGGRRSANAGPHGFSEILYAYTSATGNNGSAFAGLTANTLFYNTTSASPCSSAAS